MQVQIVLREPSLKVEQTVSITLPDPDTHSASFVQQTLTIQLRGISDTVVGEFVSDVVRKLQEPAKPTT